MKLPQHATDKPCPLCGGWLTLGECIEVERRIDLNVKLCSCGHATANAPGIGDYCTRTGRDADCNAEDEALTVDTDERLMKKTEVCRIGHSEFGSCELPYRHEGPHTRTPGGATEPVTWLESDCPCEDCVADREERNLLQPKSKSILEEAGEIVSGPRRKAYGHPKPNHDRIALLWSAYLKAKYENEFDLDAIDVVLMMDAVKTARLIETPNHRDSWVDKVGYSACGAIIEGVDEP